METSANNFEDLKVGHCYQCGKCTAGCPMSAQMDVMPNLVVRLVQMGQVARAASSQAVWTCTSCLTCSARCPKSVDCAGVMDRLRQLSVAESVAAPARQRTVLFQKAFLRNIRSNGRLNELDLIRTFKTSSFLNDLEIPFLFKDATLGPKTWKRGKLKLNSGKVRDCGIVDRIFSRCLDA